MARVIHYVSQWYLMHWIFCSLLMWMLSSVMLGGITAATSGKSAPTASCPTMCKCRSSKHEVQCVNAGLRALPPGLPPDTMRLILNLNNFTALNKDSFVQVRHLLHLEINQNKINSIQPGTFSCLHKLIYLHIGSNPISLDVLKASVFGELPSIQSLYLRDMSLKLENHSLMGLAGTPLTYLDISFNKGICDLQNGTFSVLNKLQTLSLVGCQCTNLNMLAFMNTSLKRLLLSYNRLADFPCFTLAEQPILPALEELDLGKNKISVVSARGLRGLERLQRLKLSDNDIANLQGEFIQPLPRLAMLNLDGNRIKYINATALRSNSLMKIYLQYNRFTLTSYHLNLFKQADNIEEIYLDSTGFSSNHVLETMFQNISSLRVLQMSSMKRITVIPTNTFQGLNNLEKLLLEDNAILAVDPSIFRDLTSLKALFLNANRLSIINATSFPTFFMHNLEKINLAANPFQCTCDLLWFRDWINSTKIEVLQLHDPFKNQYYCASPLKFQYKPLLAIPLSADECLTQPLSGGLVAALILSCLLFLSTLTLTGAYRYRWSLRYKLFHLNRWIKSFTAKQRKVHESSHKSYSFDAFVSYNSEDSTWIKKVLVPELEKKSDPPFYLCLFERDWLVGHDKVDCIEESIEQSRFTLLIVTNAYAHSQWCQLELTMAQHNLFDTDNDAVILAMMEDIDPLHMTPRLALEMKRRSYLEWTDDEAGQALFWEKLKSYLQSHGQSVRQAMPPSHVINKLIN